MIRIKYERKDGRDIVRIGDEVVEFFDSSDAWTFLELMHRCLGAGATAPYPVRSLVPKVRAPKRTIYIFGKVERVEAV